jgi:hypothetical protein
VAIFALAGCRQSSGSSGNAVGGVSLALTEAPFAVALTHAPLDLTNIAHVYVTLQQVDLHVVPAPSKQGSDPSVDDGSWRSVPLSATPTIDLMALHGGISTALGSLLAPPAGKITQIRLILDRQGDNRVVLSSGVSCALDLSEVPGTGIKINRPFVAIDVDQHEAVRIVIGLDLRQSLLANGACSYKLEPVISLESVERDAVDDHPGGPGNAEPQGNEGKSTHPEMGH